MNRRRPGTICCAAVLLMACALGGCATGGGSEKTPETETETETEKATYPVFRSGYTPTKFQKQVESEVTELGEGVRLVKNTVRKAGNVKSSVWAVEADLTKVSIAAGTKDNRSVGADFAHTTPYAMAQAWEAQTGGHVYASVNADFFNLAANGKCVNAFVKDGCIIKDSHNDNGNYDYTNDASDVPASLPMLFGIKGETAQIAPMSKVAGDPTDPTVKQTAVKGKFSYVLKASSDFPLTLDATNTSGLSLMRKGFRLSAGYAVRLDVAAGPAAMRVLEVVKAEGDTAFTVEDNIWYLATASAASSKNFVRYLKELKEGDTVSAAVTSPDGTWDGYTTVLGCRQALVTNGAIASTVTKENSNGAQSIDVPRTAVGLKDSHTVVVFAAESMYYGGLNALGDPHGMTLPELAEFIYYYGCNEAANFDGGGSTQLIVRGDSEEVGHVCVRSSDYGTDGLTETRAVVNALLVTSKEDK